MCVAIDIDQHLIYIREAEKLRDNKALTSSIYIPGYIMFNISLFTCMTPKENGILLNQ